MAANSSAPVSKLAAHMRPHADRPATQSRPHNDRPAAPPAPTAPSPFTITDKVTPEPVVQSVVPPSPDTSTGSPWLDATYWANINTGLATRDTGLPALRAADETARQNYTKTYASDEDARSTAYKNLGTQANDQGLYYSNILDQRTAQTGKTYDAAEQSAQNARDTTLSNNQIQRQNLLGTYGDPSKAGDYGTFGATQLAAALSNYSGKIANDVPPAVTTSNSAPAAPSPAAAVAAKLGPLLSTLPAAAGIKAPPGARLALGKPKVTKVAVQRPLTQGKPRPTARLVGKPIAPTSIPGVY